jgi:hypothetical protein
MPMKLKKLKTVLTLIAKDLLAKKRADTLLA